jgi:predicted secreted protein
MKKFTAFITVFVLMFGGIAYANVELTDANSGETVYLKVGDVVTVNLPVNASTGYSWGITDLNDAVAKHLGTVYNSECDENLVGCGGGEDWEFQAAAEGETYLEMVYYRIWLGEDSAVKEFTLNIVVSDEGSATAPDDGSEISYCVADYNNDGLVDKKDLQDKISETDQGFKRWKKDCWKSEKDCGDFDGDGKIKWKDVKARKAFEDQEVETWKNECWLPALLRQNESDDISDKAKVSECGGFDDDEAAKDGREDERLVWAYNAGSKTVTLVNKNVWLNCCGNRSVTASLNESTGIYEIYETDQAEMDGDTPLRCDCECFFDFKVKLSDVDSGVISVKISRIVSDLGKPMTAVWEGDIDLSEGEGDILIEKQSAFVSAGDGWNGALYDGKGDLLAPEATADEDAGDVAREIEEADIVKIDGTTLYILNRYRGLFVCDISQPDNPSVKGRAAVIGNPVEMYIKGNMAYIIVSDVNMPVYLLADGAESSSQTGSRIDVVDVSNKSNPRITDSFSLDGQVTDSRIVGNILYVVSSEQDYYYYGIEEPMVIDEPMLAEDGKTDSDASYEDATEPAAADMSMIAPPDYNLNRSIYIASIDVSDPNNIREADREDFEGAAQYVHVTEKAIFISSATGYYAGNNTSLMYVDISDPSGIITKRGTIDVEGWIEDEYKMDYANGYFRVCTYEWNDNGISNLFVIDVSDPDNMKIAGSVELGKGEQLFGTRFDGDRAYMVTYERKDPLWVIDLSDPTNPTVKGELIVPGWSTHIEPRGDRLIALGVDDEDGWKVAVSLFDVSDPENPSLIKRVSFGNGSGWSTSSAYGDVKAFTILDDMGLILLPYSFSDYTDGKYRNESRLQLIDYSGSDLTVRGWVSQKGSVLRSRSFQDRLFSVSDDELQVINAANRDKPAVTASLTLVRNITDFIPLDNGYGVQVVSDADGKYTLRAVRLSDPENGDAAGQVTLDESGYYSTVISNGNLLYIVFNLYNEGLYETGASAYYPVYSYSRIQVFDFSTPSNPAKRGYLDVPGSYYNTLALKGGMSVLPYSGSGQIIQMKNDLLVFPMINNYYYYPYYDYVLEADDEGDEVRPADGDEKPPADEKPEMFNGLLVADFSNPDAPVLAAEFSMDIRNGSGYFGKNGVLYFSYNEYIENDEKERPQVMYYLARVDLSDPSNPKSLPAVNIPGACVGMDDTGTYVYTTNTEWGWLEEDPQVYSFNVVKLEDDKALLMDKLELEDSFYNTVVADGLAYLSGGGYWWRGGSGNLTVIDLANPENMVTYQNDLSQGWFNIIGVKHRKVFASVSGGVACYDSSNPAQIQLDEFNAQGGWYDRISFTDSAAYLPLGYYGLWVKNF